MKSWVAENAEKLRTEPVVGGTRFVLPRRQRSIVRGVGWGVAGTGLLATVFMISWMGGPIVGGVGMLLDDEPGGIPLILFGLLGVFGFIPAAGVFLAGLTLLSGRSQCTVEVRDGKLSVHERFLLFTWRRKRDADRVRELVVTRLSSSRTRYKRSGQRPDLVDGLGESLIARGSDIKDLVMAPGYPRDLLEELANHVAEEIQAEAVIPKSDDDGPDAIAATRERQVEVRVGDLDDPSHAKNLVPTQPTASDATIERGPDGITITVPPAGLWKGSKGLFCFSLIWNGIISTVFVLATLSALGVLESGEGKSWMLLLFLIPFVAVGVGTMLMAINMGRRRAIIGTGAEQLFIVRESIFGRRQHQWRSDEIQEICCGPSGMEVNDDPVYELQIHPCHGKKVGLLGQRTTDEIEWIAAELNRVISVAGATHRSSSPKESPQLTR